MLVPADALELAPDRSLAENDAAGGAVWSLTAICTAGTATADTLAMATTSNVLQELRLLKHMVRPAHQLRCPT